MQARSKQSRQCVVLYGMFDNGLKRYRQRYVERNDVAYRKNDISAVKLSPWVALFPPTPTFPNPCTNLVAAFAPVTIHNCTCCAIHVCSAAARWQWSTNCCKKSFAWSHASCTKAWHAGDAMFHGVVRAARSFPNIHANKFIYIHVHLHIPRVWYVFHYIAHIQRYLHIQTYLHVHS